MKINRRGFISLGLGASAGLTLSPVPWKLLDDLTIWTQNWPWVPVPEGGQVSYVHSVCSLCPGGCGITVRKIDERVVAVAGKEEASTNRGGICPLGLSGPQLLYTPARVMSPMLKVSGGFQPITWKKGVSILADRVGKLKEVQGASGLACLSGSGYNMEAQLLKRFLVDFGSSHFYHTPSAEDAWESVTKKLTGAAYLPVYNLEAADAVFSFGCGLVEGWGNPVHSMGLRNLWKQNRTQLVQIEPRLSNTAAAADRWVAARPGSEADLAFGICRTIIEKYPLHRRRLAEQVTDWPGFQEMLNNRYSTGRVEAATGIPVAVVESLADHFAGMQRPLALSGKGQGRSPSDSREILSVLILNILAGNMGQASGFNLLSRQKYNRLSGSTNDDPGESKPSDELFRVLEKAQESRIGMLLVSGANPRYDANGGEELNQAMDRIPFVVSFSTYWDETATKADLVLPNHSHLERFQDIPIYSGTTTPRLGLSKPVSKKVFDTRYPINVMMALAAQLGGSISRTFTCRDYESCLKEALRDQWDNLTTDGFVELEHASAPAGFKIDIAAVDVKPAKLEGESNDFPLTLIPKASMRLNTGTVGSPPFMIKTVAKTDLKNNLGWIDINPQTASKLHLAEGDTTQLTTPAGSAVVMVHLDDGMMPGLVTMSEGLGHTAFDEYMAKKGENINRLLAYMTDPVTGYNTAWGVRAKLNKV